MISGLENPIHWIVLLAIALLVLGPKRLPEVGRSLGRGLREFKSSVTGGSDEPDEVPASVHEPLPAGD